MAQQDLRDFRKSHGATEIIKVVVFVGPRGCGKSRDPWIACESRRTRPRKVGRRPDPRPEALPKTGDGRRGEPPAQPARRAARRCSAGVRPVPRRKARSKAVASE